MQNMLPLKAKRSLSIKHKAKELGFSDCGISIISSLDYETAIYQQWLDSGQQGKMEYLNNHIHKRKDPRLLLDSAKSIISVILNYYPNRLLPDDVPKIAKYAYGQDYHKVIKKRLNKLFAFINEEITETKGKVFVDTGPVMDKIWAQRAGLGWIGKNSLLIHPVFGSYILIGEIIVDLELEGDAPVLDQCGDCSLCIDVCPNQAINDNKTINASNCISYHTIEKGHLSPGSSCEKYHNQIFGCDICLDVCPWNNHPVPNDDAELQPNPELFNMKREDWIHLTKKKYHELFKGTAVNRIGYEKIMEHIQYTDLA